MSLATMFQDKSREVALATALLIGAAGIYNNNAQASEPITRAGTTGKRRPRKQTMLKTRSCGHRSGKGISTCREQAEDSAVDLIAIG